MHMSTCQVLLTLKVSLRMRARVSLSLLFFGAISDSGTTRRWLRGRSETDAAAGSVSSMASCLRLWSACRVAMAVESQPGLINVLETIDKGTHQMFERSLSRPKRFSERVTRGRALLARFPLLECRLRFFSEKLLGFLTDCACDDKLLGRWGDTSESSLPANDADHYRVRHDSYHTYMLRLTMHT